MKLRTHIPLFMTMAALVIGCSDSTQKSYKDFVLAVNESNCDKDNLSALSERVGEENSKKFGSACFRGLAFVHFDSNGQANPVIISEDTCTKENLDKYRAMEGGQGIIDACAVRTQPKQSDPRVW